MKVPVPFFALDELNDHHKYMSKCFWKSNTRYEFCEYFDFDDMLEGKTVVLSLPSYTVIVEFTPIIDVERPDCCCFQIKMFGEIVDVEELIHQIESGEQEVYYYDEIGE